MLSLEYPVYFTSAEVKYYAATISELVRDGIIPALASPERPVILREKTLREPLAAYLLSQALGSLSGKPYSPILPARTLRSSSPHDYSIALSNRRGFDVQETSTGQLGGNPSPASITSIIWSRIQHKHEILSAQSTPLHLAVFIVQEHWKLDADELIGALKSRHPFRNYWVLAPLGQHNFVVTFLYGAAHSSPLQVQVNIKTGKTAVVPADRLRFARTS